MDNQEEMGSFDRELLIGGGCFGAAIGWSACAAWRGDWGSLAIVLAVFAAYLLYRHMRIARSIDIGWEVRDDVDTPRTRALLALHRADMHVRHNLAIAQQRQPQALSHADYLAQLDQLQADVIRQAAAIGAPESEAHHGHV